METWTSITILGKPKMDQKVSPLTYIGIVKELHRLKLRKNMEQGSYSLHWIEDKLYEFAYHEPSTGISLKIYVRHPSNTISVDYPENLLVYSSNSKEEFIEEGPWNLEIAHLFDGFQKEIEGDTIRRAEKAYGVELEEKKQKEEKLERFRGIYE